MQTYSFLGVPWWLWLLLALAVWVVVAMVRQASAKARHRVETERLAQAADAKHEGARTRHEGGA
ncbi:MAG: hypothetical protein ABIZ18_02610 [Caldimonas sp.]